MQKIFALASLITVVAIAPSFVFAFSPPSPLPFDVGLSINSLIDIILGIFWSITVFIIIIAFIGIGFLFLTSRGDPDRLAQAELALRGGFIAVVVIIVSFAIVSIVRNTIGI